MSALPAKLKKKILIFNYEFPPLGGGGGKASFFLALELVRKGWEVKVITSGFKGLAGTEKIEGIEVRRVPVIRRKIHRASIFEMITYIFSSFVFGSKIAGRDRPDFSLAYFGIPSGPAAYFQKLFFGIPYYVLLRGGDVPGFSPQEMGFYHRLPKPLIHFLWRKAEGIIANSQGLKELALKSLPQIEVKVIPNGVDQELFNLSGTKREEPREINILFAGRFTPQKGLDFLLKSLSILPPHIPSIRLWLAGDGPERGQIEKLAHEIGRDGLKITFLGWQLRPQLYQLYQEADIFVLPSRDEGMPNVLLEAMAAALPVVATRVPGSEELVRDGGNGFLVDKEDLKGLAQALEKLVSQPGIRRQMGMEGRKIAREYSWEQIAARFVEYLSLRN